MFMLYCPIFQNQVSKPINVLPQMQVFYNTWLILLLLFVMTMMIVFDNNHWTLGVVNNVVTDGTQNSATHSSQPTGTHHYQPHITATLLNDALPWFSSCHAFYFSTQLKKQKIQSVHWILSLYIAAYSLQWHNNHGTLHFYLIK